MAKKIEVGDVARDTITGFEGVVIARTEWLNGCARVTLQPKALHEGKPVEAQCFDELQLEVLQRKGFKPVRETGGPRPAATRAKDPSRR
jgi:hypothetical protein